MNAARTPLPSGHKAAKAHREAVPEYDPVRAMTPADQLVVKRAAAGSTLDDIALDMLLDDCAHLRAYGGRETRTLDDALRVKRAQAGRALDAYRRTVTKKARP